MTMRLCTPMRTKRTVMIMTAHADEDGHDHVDEEDVAVSNAAAHEDDAADHTVVAAPDGHDAHEHGEYDPIVWTDPDERKTGKCKISAKC